MNEMMLWLAAMLLSLFCLIHSITSRRDLYYPLPKGLSEKLRNRHTVYLGLLLSIIWASVFTVAEAMAINSEAGAGAFRCYSDGYAHAGYGRSLRNA